MAVAGEWVEHDCAADGRKARIEVPHEGCKLAAITQNPGIARRKRKSALVRRTRLREIESSHFQNGRRCEVGLGQIRRKDKRLARIRLRLVIAFTRRRWGLGLRGGSGKDDRSPGEGERIVRIEANRFRVRGNRGWQVFGFVYRAIRLCRAQICIEGARILRAAELDFDRDIPEQRDFKSAGHRGGNLGLKFQYIP